MTDVKAQLPGGGERIVPRLIEEEMKQSYLNYSMSVIVGRALPDVRDGLKPVHRRVLFTMFENNLVHNKPFRKSANVVGTCMARYHPHGDAAIYDTLVRMAQDFSLRYLLIQGQGNFGSVDGDAAAAMRYTEARLTKFSEDLLEDIDKETVEFTPNFDGSLKEPTVLPSKIPNLLVNGSSGIAVGMATNIPPHNLKEVCSAVVALIDNPDVGVKDLMNYIVAPDFPTGGLIIDDGGLQDAYEHGRGRVVVRARMNVEERRSERMNLIVTEIPYQVNKAQLIEDIARLVREKVVQGILDIRDESDRDGMRVVFELKAGANPDIVQNQLFKHSRLQTTFGIINLALVNNQPQTLSLKSMLSHFVNHRLEMVTRRCQFDLKKAEEKNHILEGLIVALIHIDQIVSLIKGSKSAEVAKAGLQASFPISEIQAQAILDMRLQRLTSLEQDKIRHEQSELVKLISRLRDILSSPKNVLNIIREEMIGISKEYGDSRKTVVEAGRVEIEEVDIIKPEEVVVTISHAGYAKRLPLDTYHQQRRGGRGVTGATTRDQDFIEDLFVANTHDTLLVFTNTGKVHWLKVFDLPSTGRTAMGTALVNLLSLDEKELPSACIPIQSFDPSQFVFMSTAKGVVKKVALDSFANPRKGGILAVSLQPDDELIGVLLTQGKQQVLLATKNGMAVKFDESDVRDMGRSAMGVRGIRLKGDDRVIGLVLAAAGKEVLTVTRKGFGKRTAFDEYRLTSRGGVGVINIKISEKNGPVVSVLSVQETEGLMVISKNGIIIRTSIGGISSIGRATQGVRVMRLEENDEVMSATVIAPEENEGLTPLNPLDKCPGNDSNDDSEIVGGGLGNQSSISSIQNEGGEEVGDGSLDIPESDPSDPLMESLGVPNVIPILEKNKGA